MSKTIDEAFRQQYESEVKEAYQRMGALLKNTVRYKQVGGESTTFQKTGKGTAVSKDRNGVIKPMNVEHNNVKVTMDDFYAGDWVDKLDEYKTNIDERQVLANAGAYALGRKTDDLIITQLQSATQYVGDYSTGVTLALLSQGLEALNDQDVPDDGQRFGVLSNHAWEEFINIPEVSNADYAGEKFPWLKGSDAITWRNTTWMRHSGLPLADTDNRDCYLYHKTALGLGENADVETDITWHGDRAAHFINNMMSQGAVLIDTLGVVELRVDDDTALS